MAVLRLGLATSFDGADVAEGSEVIMPNCETRGITGPREIDAALNR